MNELFEEYGGLLLAIVGALCMFGIVGAAFFGNYDTNGTIGNFVKTYMEQMLG